MSDYESESESDFMIDPLDILDIFIFNENDNIIDLHEDLRNRIPYFFKYTSLPLYTFLLNHIFDDKKTYKKTYKKVNEYFINEYNKEIQVTLDTVNNYILNRKDSLKCGFIKLIDWQVFCYENFT